MANLALTFSDAEMARLEAVAAHMGVTINQVIRQAIKQYIQRERESAREQKISAKSIPVANSDDVTRALWIVDEIEELAGQVPERGEEYAESVLGKAASIGEAIEERGHVTEGQITALENMRDGLQRWVRD